MVNGCRIPTHTREYIMPLSRQKAFVDQGLDHLCLTSDARVPSQFTAQTSATL